MHLIPLPGDQEKHKATLRESLELGMATLRPLPFALEEVTSAASEAGPSSLVLSGERASEADLKASMFSRFRILHFAAHGITNERNPERAGIVLHPGSGEDGLWQPREIRRAALDADLVTLSACETGVGKLEGQEGVATLARIFLLAGAKNVVATLWAVDDRASSTVMAKFYRHLRCYESVASALRSAQLEMLREFGQHAPPYYWAGFQITGDGANKIQLWSSASVTRAASYGLR